MGLFQFNYLILILILDEHPLAFCRAVNTCQAHAKPARRVERKSLFLPRRIFPSELPVPTLLSCPSLDPRFIVDYPLSPSSRSHSSLQCSLLRRPSQIHTRSLVIPRLSYTSPNALRNLRESPVLFPSPILFFPSFGSLQLFALVLGPFRICEFATYRESRTRMEISRLTRFSEASGHTDSLRSSIARYFIGSHQAFLIIIDHFHRPQLL